MAIMINTATVTDRRQLHFRTPEELAADVARLVEAERGGSLRTTGNWSLGQSLGHLAVWIDYAYDGYPPELRPPWFVKLVLKMMKKKFLKGPLKAGVRIPKLKEGTLGTEALSVEEGFARFDKAWRRLRNGPPSVPNPIFGPMSHEEWIAGHLRHAELHLGFFHPEE